MGIQGTDLVPETDAEQEYVDVVGFEPVAGLRLMGIHGTVVGPGSVTLGGLGGPPPVAEWQSGYQSGGPEGGKEPIP